MTIWVWRHPPAQGARGRCIGRTDLPVDPRRAKRLAHRIRQAARRHGLPRQVFTSALQRSAAVGAWLRRWGWQHTVEPLLAEMDFGTWDGCAWTDIAHAEVDAWCADFLHHAPGQGESLQRFFERVAAWSAPSDTVLVVGHGGWMLARRWLCSSQALPTRADQWPAAPAHGQLWKISR
ncbi:MAG: histidine phosphatase family protein [Roseateles sp.]